MYEDTKCNIKCTKNMFLFCSISFSSFIDLTGRCVSISSNSKNVYVFKLSPLVCPKLHPFFFPSPFQSLSTSTTGPHW